MSNAFQQITPEEAKKIMDEELDYTILDVRTQQEFDDGHIEGAVLIPLPEVPYVVESEIEDYDQTILVYCRSGVRSKSASAILAELGYTNVYEFGGILDWPYDIEQ
ncbi:MAG: rhodanese-like domain-containing protein [bacterium]|nr:rhodanese-like domain-containing protein [bacterium]